MMRHLNRVLLIAWILSGAMPAKGQTTADASTRQAIRAAFDSLNAAASRRDRAALERVYAVEFLFIHATGGIITRKEQIDGIVNRAAAGPGVPTPSLDSLRVYGDAAALRTVDGNRFSHTILVRRDGRWQFALAQGTYLPEKRVGLALDRSRLAQYEGRYVMDTLFVLLTVAGDSLMVQRATGPKTALMPIGPDQFEDRFGALLTFTRESTGAIAHFTYRPQNGPERTWRRAK